VAHTPSHRFRLLQHRTSFKPPRKAKTDGAFEAYLQPPTRIEFNGVQVGQWKDNDFKIVSLNVYGLDGGEFEELLAYMDTQGLGVLVLQDTRL